MTSSGIVTLQGDFTALRYIATLNASELERTVGYHKGRLSTGFLVVVLAGDEVIEPDDFELAASTRYSGGVVSRGGPARPRGIEEILIDRGQNLGELKKKVCLYFARRGGATPAKVLPNLRHTDGMVYPDAEALGPGIRSGVPQFRLVKPKRFVIVRRERC